MQDLLPLPSLFCLSLFNLIPIQATLQTYTVHDWFLRRRRKLRDGLFTAFLYLCYCYMSLCPFIAYSSSSELAAVFCGVSWVLLMALYLSTSLSCLLAGLLRSGHGFHAEQTWIYLSVLVGSLLPVWLCLELKIDGYRNIWKLMLSWWNFYWLLLITFQMSFAFTSFLLMASLWPQQLLLETFALLLL